MSDLPPAYQSIKDVYEQLPQETKNQIKALASLSAEASVRSKMLVGMEQWSAGETFQDEVLEEVDILSKSVLQLDKAFETIKAELETLGGPNNHYRPTWEGYQRRWIQFLGRSREAATAAEAEIEKFVQIILPVVQIAFPEAEFQLFQGVWKALELISRHPDPAVRWLDADEPRTNSNEFISLKNDLDRFTNTFDDYARSQNVSFTDAFKAKKAEIAVTRTEITKRQTLLAGLERGVILDLFDLKTDDALMEGRCAVLAPVTGLSFVVAVINSVVADASAINGDYEKLSVY